MQSIHRTEIAVELLLSSIALRFAAMSHKAEFKHKMAESKRIHWRWKRENHRERKANSRCRTHRTAGSNAILGSTAFTSLNGIFKTIVRKKTETTRKSNTPELPRKRNLLFNSPFEPTKFSWRIWWFRSHKVVDWIQSMFTWLIWWMPGSVPVVPHHWPTLWVPCWLLALPGLKLRPSTAHLRLVRRWRSRGLVSIFDHL